MLGKLFKYEMKNTARIFLPVYGAILVIGLITRLLWLMVELLPDEVTLLFSMTTVSAVMLLILVMALAYLLTFFIMVARFYSNLLRDEGYLMFTLPATSSELILSKAATSLIWMIGSSIVSALAMMIAIFHPEMYVEIWRVLQELISAPEVWMHTQEIMHVIAYIGEGVLLSILTALASVLMIYASLCIGQLFSKHKLAAGLCVLAGFSVAIQIIVTIGSVVLAMVLSNSGAPIMEWITRHLVGATHGFMGINIAVMAGACVGLFFISKHILEKKLNLE